MPLRLGGDGRAERRRRGLPPVRAGRGRRSPRTPRRLYLLLAARPRCCSTPRLFRIVAVASRRLRHQALHDDLTDLPNRALLYERMEDAMTAAERTGEPAALLLIDLDRFKEVNDTLGHDQGDRLLEEVAVRLRERRAPRRHARAARRRRVRGAPARACPHRGAGGRAGRAPAGRAGPPVLARRRGRPCSTPASASPSAPTTAPTCTRSSSAPTSRCTTPSARAPASRPTPPERDPYSAERLQLLGELRAAIGAGELVLHYQPKVDVGSAAGRRRRGAGALAAPACTACSPPRRVRAAGRAHGRDRRPHPLGARHRARAGARLARRRPRPHDGRQPRRGRTSPTRRSRTPSPSCSSATASRATGSSARSPSTP